MTPQQKSEYKAEVKAAMMEYLKNAGLIDANNEMIMQNLQNMYRHLEEKQLIKYGLNYKMFYKFAHEQFVFAQLKGQF